MMSYNCTERTEAKVSQAHGIICKSIFIVVEHLDIKKDSKIGKTQILVEISMEDIKNLTEFQIHVVERGTGMDVAKEFL